MGASVMVAGVRDLDERFADMWEIKERCDRQGVELPPEVRNYLGDAADYKSREDAEREHREVHLRLDPDLKEAIAGEPEYGDGMVVDLRKLPGEIKMLRIYVSG